MALIYSTALISMVVSGICVHSLVFNGCFRDYAFECRCPAGSGWPSRFFHIFDVTWLHDGTSTGRFENMSGWTGSSTAMKKNAIYAFEFHTIHDIPGNMLDSHSKIQLAPFCLIMPCRLVLFRGEYLAKKFSTLHEARVWLRVEGAVQNIKVPPFEFF